MQESPAVRDALVKLTRRYDRGAAVYRELWAPVLRTAALPVVRELAGHGVKRVLDLAAGVGTLLPELQAAFPGARVTGVDLSRGMLALAPPGFARALMDARLLAVRDSSMNRVFVMFMLFHLEHPEVALREVHRVLRPGGQIGTVTWGVELESRASQTWAECLDRHGAIPPDADAQRRHAAVESPAKMEALLCSAGFAEVRSWTDDLVTRIETEPLLRLKMNLGFSKDRFDSLPPDRAAACVEEARHRMSALAADDFLSRATVICTTATRLS
jgi:SAM-dependent methyltransferase